MTNSAAHQFDRSVLREYDVRGIVGKTLHPADANALGKAFGTIVRRSGGKRVALGRDGRLSSPELAAALEDGILSTGCDVVRIGCGPTPMLYFTVYDEKTDAGIMVTGSHNPSDYNGFKMLNAGKSVFGEAIQELGRIAAAGDFEVGQGSASDLDVEDRFVERLLAELDCDVPDPMTIVWDCGNGAAGDVVRKLTARLQVRIICCLMILTAPFPTTIPTRRLRPIWLISRLLLPNIMPIGVLPLMVMATGSVWLTARAMFFGGISLFRFLPPTYLHGSRGQRSLLT